MNCWPYSWLFSPNKKQNAKDIFSMFFEVDINFKMCNNPKVVEKQNKSQFLFWFNFISKFIFVCFPIINLIIEVCHIFQI